MEQQKALLFLDFLESAILLRVWALWLWYQRQSEAGVDEVISASLQSLIALQSPCRWKPQAHGKNGERDVESAGEWVAECGCAAVGIKDQNKHWKLIHKMIHVIRIYQDDEVCEVCVVCCN